MSTSDAQFRSTPLFGGSITADLPSTYQDVSTIRQVPDNQEVYLDTNGYTSIIIEILERVEKPTEAEALKFHLSDIVSEDSSSTEIFEMGEAFLTKMPDIKALTCLATSPPGEKMRGRQHEPEFVALCVLIVRLKEQGTDVVVVVNVPHVPGEGEGGGGYVSGSVDVRAGRKGVLIERGLRIRERILETLRVEDWGLFVDE